MSESADKPAQPRSRKAAFVLVALLSGAASALGTWVLARREAAPPHPVSTSATQPQAQPQPPAGGELWICPMHPNIVQDRPGDCPICGMKLVKIEGSDGSTVTIDPTRQQLIGLTTAAVEHGEIGATWRTSGRVAMDETRVRHVNVKTAGFVEKVYVDFIGKQVTKGQPLFAIYSPELYAAQQEYLLAMKTRSALGGRFAGDGDDLVKAARRKLELWDVPAADIEKLERTGVAQRTLTLRSPQSGVVVKKDVVQGMRLEAGAMPYEIVDLSHVWVLADVYESELRHVTKGMKATLMLKAFPNRPVEGEVVFVDPVLDPTTRTVKVRLTFPNPPGDLRPEMFGEVTLHGTPRQGLRIPSDAIIYSGTKTIVFVALGEGKFQPRGVKTGESDGATTEVVEGLNPGERVVTRANFLVDSESRLRASLQAATGGAPAPPPPPGHQGH